MAATKVFALAKPVLVSLLLVLPGAPALASNGIIYKSTDAAGHVVYGDDPVPGAVKVDIVRIRATAELDKDALAAQNAALEQLAATTKRLQDDRKDREKERLETAQRQEQSDAQYYSTAPPVAQGRAYYDGADYYPTPYYPPGYYPPGYYPHGYYGHESRQDVHYGANWSSSKWRVGVSYGSDTPYYHRDRDRPDESRHRGHGDNHFQPPLRPQHSLKAPGRFK